MSGPPLLQDAAGLISPTMSVSSEHGGANDRLTQHPAQPRRSEKLASLMLVTQRKHVATTVCGDLEEFMLAVDGSK